jgi:hypothetical protein
MGFSITWCAIREDKSEQFFQRLGLAATGEVEEFPESLISIARLNTGWRVMWYNKYGCPFLQTGDLRRISLDQDVLLCSVEEHVMASSSEMWSYGKCQWRVSHEGENGPKGLSTDGVLPDSFPAIRNDMEKAQLAAGGDEAGVDYIFDIPLKLAQSLVGFKHDEACTHLLDKGFSVMSRTAPAAGLLRRLFRK